MKKSTILIADDHTLVREAWSLIFNSHNRYCVVAECGSGEEAIKKAKELRPNVVIMDINLPGINGIEATRQIRKFSPASRVLGVSLHTQPTYARKMVQSGAMGYVTKNSSREEMFKALTEIQNGKKYICQEIKNILSEQVISGEDQQTALISLSQGKLRSSPILKRVILPGKLPMPWKYR